MNVASDAAWAAGFRILQGNRLGPTDAEHVAALLRHMDPPQGALVADMGCGFGEVARLMRQQRPDLSFVLVNRNARQMERAPADEGFRHVLANMHDTPLEAASVDGAMFLYALCHADLAVALGEAARIVRPGGFLFVYDYVRQFGTDAHAERLLHAWFRTFGEYRDAAREAGWKMTLVQDTGGDPSPFGAMFADARDFVRVFRGTKPMFLRMIRRP